MCLPIAFWKLKHMCSPPMIKMTCANLGFAHTSSLPLLYNGWSAVIIVRFWPTWFQISTKRLITVVSVVVICWCLEGGSTVLVASLSALQGGTDRSSPLLCIRDTIQARVLHGPGLGPRAGPARSPWDQPCGWAPNWLQ